MLFLLIFLFFQACLTVQEPAKNLSGELFLGSPVEEMTPFKYKFTKWSSRVAPLLPVASALYFTCFQRMKTEKILKNKFFLSGFGICSIIGLIGIKKTYDVDQYVFHSLPLIFKFYRDAEKNYSEINREQAIKIVVANEKIRDFLIFYLPKDDIAEDIAEAKIFFSKQKPEFDIEKLINDLQKIAGDGNKLEE